MFYNNATTSIFKYHTSEIDTWAQDQTGMTVLHYLAWSSRSTTQDLVRCFPTKDMPQLSIKDAQGKSVLHYATQRGNIELINFLLSRPEAATLCMCDHLGRTLLHYATESSRVTTIDLFLSLHYDPDTTDDAGRTILHHACQWGNLKAVKHLVNLGLEHQLDALDHDKRTPLQLAIAYRSRAVVRYLQAMQPNDGLNEQLSDKSGVMHTKKSLVECTGISSKWSFLVLTLLIHLVFWIVYRR
jgi:ankyrin repeat protein